MIPDPDPPDPESDLAKPVCWEVVENTFHVFPMEQIDDHQCFMMIYKQFSMIQLVVYMDPVDLWNNDDTTSYPLVI